MDLSNTFYPEKQIVPYIKVTQDRCVLEINVDVQGAAVFVRRV